MVDKKTDGTSSSTNMPAYPADHIGWSLWQGARVWQTLFVGKVRALGHEWFTMSSSTLMGNLSRKGATQKLLTERVGLSKQAVNQQIDELVGVEILVREVSAQDKRVRVVRYTEKGRAALVEIDRIKLEIEAEFAQIIGADDMVVVKRAIDALVAAEKSKPDR